MKTNIVIKERSNKKTKFIQESALEQWRYKSSEHLSLKFKTCFRLQFPVVDTDKPIDSLVYERGSVEHTSRQKMRKDDSQLIKTIGKAWNYPFCTDRWISLDCKIKRI